MRELAVVERVVCWWGFAVDGTIEAYFEIAVHGHFSVAF
jgi:hypothetical protein